MDVLKQIKYNRIIRNYLLKLSVRKNDNAQGMVYHYITNTFDLVFTVKKGFIVQSNIVALCRDLGIDFSSKVYKDIISIIEEMYNVKGL